MKIYRIEHPVSGKGPFTHTGPKGFASDAMYCIEEPSEMGYNGALGFHFGFSSVEALAKSIMRFSILSEHGMQILVFESNSQIVFDDGQVAFNRKTASLLERHEIVDFNFHNQI